jgi:hypothetical protein
MTSLIFIIITEKLSVQQIEKRDVITILNNSFPGNFPGIKMVPIWKLR